MKVFIHLKHNIQLIYVTFYIHLYNHDIISVYSKFVVLLPGCNFGLNTGEVEQGRPCENFAKAIKRLLEICKSNNDLISMQ